MNATEGQMSLILGTDVLQKNKDKFYKDSTCIIKDEKEIIAEVGPPGSRECFTLIEIRCFILVADIVLGSNKQVVQEECNYVKRTRSTKRR